MSKTRLKDNNPVANESKDTSPKKTEVATNRKRSAEAEHIAFHSGIDPDDLESTVQYEKMKKVNLALGLPEKESKNIAAKVTVGLTAAAITKKLKTSATPEEARELLHHAPFDTDNYDSNGNFNQNVFNQLYDPSYAEKDSDGTLIVTESKLKEFVKARFIANQETSGKKTCCPFFASAPSRGEFGAFVPTYMTRVTTIHGAPEPCITLADLKEFYENPYVAGQKAIAFHAQKKEEAAKHTNTPSKT